MTNVSRFYSILVLIVMFSTSEKCLTEQIQDVKESEEKLPVIINRGYKVLDGKSVQEFAYDNAISNLKKDRLVPIEEKADIDYGKISKLVSSIRSKLCSINQDGSYEVWLQVEGGASGVFVSASAQTGIKATINCSTEHK